MAHPPNDRDQVRKAREAAEALFRPQRAGAAQTAPVAAPSIASAPASGSAPASAGTPGNGAGSNGSISNGMTADGASAAPVHAEALPVRQPRIIVIPAAMPLRQPDPEPVAAPRPKRQLAPRQAAGVPRRKHKIAASDHNRIRTLATYGMTPEQVAELYDVPVGEIERILDH
jgi:hypothetical protein